MSYTAWSLTPVSSRYSCARSQLIMVHQTCYPERTAALDGAKYGSLLSEFAACCILMGQDLLSCTFTCLQGSLHAGVDGKVCCLASKEEHTAHRRCQSIPVHKHTLLWLVSVLEILLKASALVWPSTEAPVYLPIRLRTF